MRVLTIFSKKMGNKVLDFMDWMINRFILDEKVFRNPLFKLPLWGLQVFGYMISTDQWVWKPHCFRGTVFTISFVLFNISQVKNSFTWKRTSFKESCIVSTLIWSNSGEIWMKWCKTRQPRYFSPQRQSECLAFTGIGHVKPFHDHFLCRYEQK